MRRKRAMPSRKYRTRDLVSALCLLVAACHFTDIYVLTLGRTLERQDRYWLTGPTELTRWSGTHTAGRAASG